MLEEGQVTLIANVFTYQTCRSPIQSIQPLSLILTLFIAMIILPSQRCFYWDSSRVLLTSLLGLIFTHIQRKLQNFLDQIVKENGEKWLTKQAGCMVFSRGRIPRCQLRIVDISNFNIWEGTCIRLSKYTHSNI